MLDSIHFLDGGGESGAAIRRLDWSGNPLGHPGDWPSALKTAVSMALASKFPKCLVWGPELIMLHNDAFRPILGDKPGLGLSFRDVWSEVWDEVGPIAERAYAGEATFIEDFPLVIDRYGYPEQCYFTFCYSPIRDEDGIVRGMMDTVMEVTGKVEAQRQARLLNSELEHRIRNTLAVAQAIVNQTFQADAGKDETKASLLRRLSALANAQSLLTRGGMAEATIGDVIEHALAPFQTDRAQFDISGPPVRLSAKQAMSLVLAINELATNATKYGALSSGSGRIDLSWQAGRPGTEDEFRLSWVESGGPPVREPVRKGFGTRVIQTVLARDFRGTTELSYDPAGVQYRLAAQMRHVGT